MVCVIFNIPREMIFSQLNTYYNGDTKINKICITGEFDGWKQCEKNSVYFDEIDDNNNNNNKKNKNNKNTSIKIVVELPDQMQKSEFKVVVDGYKWLTLKEFDICSNSNNILDISVLNEYYYVETSQTINDKMIKQKEIDSPMYDVVLESCYNSQILNDPGYQNDFNINNDNTNNKRQVKHCRKDRDNPKNDPNTIIVLDNVDINTQKHKNYTYTTTTTTATTATTNNKNRGIKTTEINSCNSSSSSNDSQISDDAYSVYRYEQLDIEEHYLDDGNGIMDVSYNNKNNNNNNKGNVESYANIVSNIDYNNNANKTEDISMNGSLYSANSSSTFNKLPQEDKNKYIIPMQMENGICTPTSMSTLSTSSVLKSSSSNTSLLMQQGSTKLGGSSSNKMKLKALMKSFFWKE